MPTQWRSSSPSLNRADWCKLAYRQLDLATSRQQDHLLPLHDLANLQRPWDPATCQTLQLRREVWSWLEAVVTWLNHEHVWDVADVIPPCWPQHPHLVHELAVLADQRHHAGRGTSHQDLERPLHRLPDNRDRRRDEALRHSPPHRPRTCAAATRQALRLPHVPGEPRLPHRPRCQPCCAR